MLRRTMVSNQMRTRPPSRALIQFTLSCKFSEFTFRRLLNVEDHESRGGVSEVQSDLLAVKNHSDAEDHASDILRRPADFNLPAERVKRVVSWFQFSYHGRISLQIIASCYCFLMLAIICDEYFIGCVEVLCQSKFDLINFVVNVVKFLSPRRL